jgi:hypothetical protein
VLARLIDGYTQPLDRERVLGPDVDEALVRANRVASNRHRLNDAVGIALEDAAVHERARVALIGIAHHPLGAAFGISDKIPLDPCREPRAAPPAQAGCLDLVDHLLPGRLRHGLRQRLVSVPGDVLLDIRGIDHAAVAQHDLLLLGEEVDLVEHREQFTS